LTYELVTNAAASPEVEPRDFYEVYPDRGRWHGKVWRDGEVVYHQDYGDPEVAEQVTRARYLAIITS